ATFAREVKKWKRAYVVTDQSMNNTVSATNDFLYSWGKEGGTVTDRDTFVSTDQSFATQITRLKSAAGKTDFVFLSANVPGGPTFLKQLRAAGVGLPVVVHGAMGGTWWTSAVSNADLKNVYAWAGGLASPSSADPNPGRRALFERY